MRHVPVVIAVLAAVAVGAGLALHERTAAPPELRAGTALPEPRALPEFSLTDQSGRPFDAKAVQGVTGPSCSRASPTAPTSAPRPSR